MNYDRGWLIFLTSAGVALTALHQFIWLYRGRFTKRWKAVLNAYAEREISRDRFRKAPPTTVEANGRNSNYLKTLKDCLAEELTDLAYPVILRQGVKGPFVDVELAIWRAIDGTLQEILKPFLTGTVQTPLAAAIVLARLTKAVYRASQRHGFQGTFADVEVGLWDAFHTGSFPGHANDLLHALFRGAKEAFEARPAWSPNPVRVAE